MFRFSQLMPLDTLVTDQGVGQVSKTRVILLQSNTSTIIEGDVPVVRQTNSKRKVNKEIRSNNRAIKRII